MFGPLTELTLQEKTCQRLFPTDCRHSQSSAFVPLADIPYRWQPPQMRPACLSLLLLSSCALDSPRQCGEVFCLPSNAELVDKREIEDFNLYRMRWNGERIGIYEGDHPDFQSRSAKDVIIPIDANAKLLIENGQGQVLARLHNDWPQFLHLTGPCSSRDDCSVLEAASSLTRRR